MLALRHSSQVSIQLLSAASRLNTARLDGGWDRKRGAAVKLTAVLLRGDDSALARKVDEFD